MEMTDGGADYYFECVGMASLVHEAYASCRKGWGKTIIVGVDKPGARLSFSSCMEGSNRNLMFHFCLSITWTREECFDSQQYWQVWNYNDGILSYKEGSKHSKPRSYSSIACYLDLYFITDIANENFDLRCSKDSKDLKAQKVGKVTIDQLRIMLLRNSQT
ncbi:hypothetical protein RYX36_027226 [Vicia faba]